MIASIPVPHGARTGEALGRLGLQDTAPFSRQEVESAFRMQARHVHPDRKGATNDFIEAKAASDYLVAKCVAADLARQQSVAQAPAPPPHAASARSQPPNIPQAAPTASAHAPPPSPSTSASAYAAGFVAPPPPPPKKATAQRGEQPEAPMGCWERTKRFFSSSGECFLLGCGIFFVAVGTFFCWLGGKIWQFVTTGRCGERQ